jgi:predicted RNA-binding Zn-ribbon protein involved in translation (DUF1610 family)
MPQHICPSCGKESLYLHTANIYCKGVKIEEDGFDIWEGRSISTSDETVICNDCGYQGELGAED